MATLVEKLGYRSDDRVVIINCDDLGSSAEANEAIYRSLREGIATSTTWMAPCPAADDAIRQTQGEDIGVHLTLNSEWDAVCWGPLTESPSLLDERGSLPRTLQEMWEGADLEEVRRECRAQIEALRFRGIEPTHLDSHMGTLQLREEFFSIYVELAVEYRLPLRMASANVQDLVGFDYLGPARDSGIVFPDLFVYTEVGSRDAFRKTLRDLPAGVTEIYAHPICRGGRAETLPPDADRRFDDFDLLLGDLEIRDLLARSGARTISFRPLRELQRTGG